MYIQSPYRRVDIKDLIHADSPCVRATSPQPGQDAPNQKDISRDGGIHIEMRFQLPFDHFDQSTLLQPFGHLRLCRDITQQPRHSTQGRIIHDSVTRQHLRLSPPPKWPSKVLKRQPLTKFGQVRPELVSLTPLTRTPRSNIAYSIEEEDWIRYHREDLGMSWGEDTCTETGEIRSIMVLKFRRQFPKARVATPQGLNSRHYRGNKFFLVFDEHDDVVIIDGRPSRERITIREGKKRGKGKTSEAANPEHTLVSMHPHRALTYDWVLDVHKAAIMKSLEDPRARSRSRPEKKIHYAYKH
ncbi:hypothetical protein PVAG01_09380 [Phlyctema vagabunda]|uniref:Uncharacterized protein n=1 Tax=Phlyctema vagabunda TaxID=108571 RepID=A0ABR4P7C3_9HELO